MKELLLGILILIGLAMIIIGVLKPMLPPIMTGAGFIVIAALFSQKKGGRGRGR